MICPCVDDYSFCANTIISHENNRSDVTYYSNMTIRIIRIITHRIRRYSRYLSQRWETNGSQIDLDLRYQRHSAESSEFCAPENEAVSVFTIKSQPLAALPKYSTTLGLRLLQRVYYSTESTFYHRQITAELSRLIKMLQLLCVPNVLVCQKDKLSIVELTFNIKQPMNHEWLQSKIHW